MHEKTFQLSNRTLLKYLLTSCLGQKKVQLKSKTQLKITKQRNKRFNLNYFFGYLKTLLANKKKTIL